MRGGRGPGELPAPRAAVAFGRPVPAPRDVPPEEGGGLLHRREGVADDASWGSFGGRRRRDDLLDRRPPDRRSGESVFPDGALPVDRVRGGLAVSEINPDIQQVTLTEDDIQTKVALMGKQI